MNNLKITSSPEFKQVFSNYPESVQGKMLSLRRLILETANETEGIANLEETLKWGEPSFLVKNGSTVRIDWKAKSPDQYTIYFKCTSQLVPTFRLIYGDHFTFEGNRAIVFQLNDKVPEAELKKCIRSALTYHKVKHLPRLGL